MEVTFTLTPEDILHYARRYRYRSMKIRPALLYAFLGLMVFLIVCSLWIAQNSWRRTGAVPWTLLIGPAIIFWAVSLLLPPTQRGIAKFIRKQPETVMPHFVGISPEWLSARTSLNESKRSWQTLHSVEDDAEYLYLFIAKASAHIIPKRAFGSVIEAQAFLDQSRQYWQAAKTGQVFPTDDTTWPPPPRPAASSRNSATR